MVARYKVLQDTFIQPELVFKGSIIAFSGTPGNHLAPLNEEARAAMELWYNEEHLMLDRDGKPTETVFKPHEKFRPTEYKPSVPLQMKVLRRPAKDDMTGVVTIAEAMVKGQSGDYILPPGDEVEDVSEAEAFADAHPDEEIEIVARAPRPSFKQAGTK